jgi:drug/metabolite transporter (DMT)-like permease
MMHLNSLGQHAKVGMASQIDARYHEPTALACGLGAVLAWSTVATGFKLGLRELHPLELLWVGSAISWAFFVCATIATKRVALFRTLPRRDVLALGALGLLNPFLYYIVLFEAYDRLPAQIAQPVNYTWAITLALLAIPVLGQRLTLRTFVAILISYAGVVIVVARGDGGAGVDLLGVALALGSTLIWASYWLALTRLRPDPLVAMTLGFTVGTVAIGIACGFTYGLPALTWPRLGYGAWVGLVEMGITFLLWQQALAKTAHAGRMGQLIFLSPFISLVLIDRVLGEAVRPSAWFGLAVIVAGLLLVPRALRR